MRLAVIACRVLTRELSRIVSECENVCHVYWVEQGLHNTPDLLRQTVQQTINEIDALQQDSYVSQKFDAIVLGYGLCSNGIAGLSCRSLPIIVPKCDDCIALFLGSQKKYLELFHSIGGVYWYNPSWIEFGGVPCKQGYIELLDKYTVLYGADNAEYLVDMEKNSVANYKNCIYIHSPFYESQKLIEFSKQAAEYLGWDFVEVDGEMSFLENLINGLWDEEMFLVCPAGSMIELSHDESKIKAGCMQY